MFGRSLGETLDLNNQEHISLMKEAARPNRTVDRQTDRQTGQQINKQYLNIRGEAGKP